RTHVRNGPHPWQERVFAAAATAFRSTLSQDRGRFCKASHLFFLLGNLSAGFASLAESDGDRLLATLHFLAAARFQLPLFVLLHDFVDLAFSFGATPRTGMR